MKKIFIFFSILVLLTAPQAYSHPGGLDSQGGHTDKKTGVYHFHKKADKPVSPKTAYNRDDWPHWIDDDNDCQNTRAEILIRDNVGLLKFKRNKPCNVTWGKWVCPYTGKEFTKASDMDIDHIVPLSHAHKTGGADWSREKKREFANDPLNLVAVDDDTNKEKSDQAPDEWRPPLKSCWREYARKWRTVKRKYDLFIRPEEEKALREMD
ncbi:MAG: HNH endonuclease [Desulfobulbaceae bacterium]|nr:HNH endonuclease [Desulfobulbaceae bacterium]